MIRTAGFSQCRKYRYELWRIWGKSSFASHAMFLGLNPSTADETNDDPTVRRCIQYAKDWGYGGMCMTNIFAFRATDPKVMKAYPKPVGPINDLALRHVATSAHVIIAAWGNHGDHLGRGATVRRLLEGELHVLGLTKSGNPRHPLYLRKDLIPVPWDRPKDGFYHPTRDGKGSTFREAPDWEHWRKR